VTVPTTITADPGADEPIIYASGTNASVTIATVDDNFIHLGGIDLSSGATITVASIPGGGTQKNHYVVVLSQANQSAIPDFSIDSTSKLDLNDNDILIHEGGTTDLGYIQAALAGTSPTLISTAAILNSAGNSHDPTINGTAYPEYVLGSGLASDLPTQPASWTVGGLSEPISDDGNDDIVKYTINGDYNLDGTVNIHDYNIAYTKSARPSPILSAGMPSAPARSPPMMSHSPPTWSTNPSPQHPTAPQASPLRSTPTIP
jgi:hypothetical protein